MKTILLMSCILCAGYGATETPTERNILPEDMNMGRGQAISKSGNEVDEVRLATPQKRSASSPTNDTKRARIDLAATAELHQKGVSVAWSQAWEKSMVADDQLMQNSKAEVWPLSNFKDVKNFVAESSSIIGASQDDFTALPELSQEGLSAESNEDCWKENRAYDQLMQNFEAEIWPLLDSEDVQNFEAKSSSIIGASQDDFTALPELSQEGLSAESNEDCWKENRAYDQLMQNLKTEVWPLSNFEDVQKFVAEFSALLMQNLEEESMIASQLLQDFVAEYSTQFIQNLETEGLRRGTEACMRACKCFLKDLEAEWLRMGPEACMKAYKQFLKDSDQLMQNLEAEVGQLYNSLVELLKSDKELNFKIEQALSKKEQSNSEIDRARYEIKQANSKIEQAESEIKQANSKINRARYKKKKAKHEIEQAESEIKEAESKKKQAESEIEQAVPGVKEGLNAIYKNHEKEEKMSVSKGIDFWLYRLSGCNYGTSGGITFKMSF